MRDFDKKIADVPVSTPNQSKPVIVIDQNIKTQAFSHLEQFSIMLCDFLEPNSTEVSQRDWRNVLKYLKEKTV